MSTVKRKTDAHGNLWQGAGRGLIGDPLAVNTEDRRCTVLDSRTGSRCITRLNRYNDGPDCLNHMGEDQSAERARLVAERRH